MMMSVVVVTGFATLIIGPVSDDSNCVKYSGFWFNPVNKNRRAEGIFFQLSPSKKKELKWVM